MQMVRANGFEISKFADTTEVYHEFQSIVGDILIHEPNYPTRENILDDALFDLNEARKEKKIHAVN